MELNFNRSEKFWNIQIKKSKLILFIFIILSVIAAVYFRLKGLGKFPLAVDEYYIAQSVRNILHHGLPKFDLAGYYDRGILYQYILVPLYVIGIKAEFAGRIVTVISSMITLIPVYLISKKVSGRILGAILIFVLCFSVWEVELARFARMYAPFQMIFAFYLYALYKNLIENDKKSLKWLIVLSFISVFTYEASIFLCILNFIPVLWDQERKLFDISNIFKLKGKTLYLIFSVIILICAYAFLTINFRYLGTPLNSVLPPDLPETGAVPGANSMIRMPKLLILTLFSSKLFLILFLIPAATIIYSLFNLIKNQNIDISGKFSFAVLIILPVFNLFGLMAAVFILFYFTGGIKKKNLKSAFYAVLIPAAISFIFWTIFALKTSVWYNLFPGIHFAGAVSILKVLWKEFINYPYFYETFVLFRDTIPNYTYVITALIFTGIVFLFLKKREDDLKIRLLFSIFIILILLVNILNLTYFKTRYFFFLYPLTLLLAFESLQRLFQFFIKNRKISQYIFLITSIIIILFVSEDFNLNHLFNIDTKRVNYRINYTYTQKDHYYPRWDTRTPAEIINNDASPQDIIITNEQVNDFYLKRLDYVYKDYRGNMIGVSADHGKKEIWTNADLLYDDQQLIYLLNHNKNQKWVIINTEWGIRYLEKDGFFKEFKKYIFYTNPDSSAILYKIPGKS